MAAVGIFKQLLYQPRTFHNITAKKGEHPQRIHVVPPKGLAAVLTLAYSLILPTIASGQAQAIGIEFGPEIMSGLPAHYPYRQKYQEWTQEDEI